MVTRVVDTMTGEARHAAQQHARAAGLPATLHPARCTSAVGSAVRAAVQYASWHLRPALHACLARHAHANPFPLSTLCIWRAAPRRAWLQTCRAPRVPRPPTWPTWCWTELTASCWEARPSGASSPWTPCAPCWPSASRCGTAGACTPHHVRCMSCRAGGAGRRLRTPPFAWPCTIMRHHHGQSGQHSYSAQDTDVRCAAAELVVAIILPLHRKCCRFWTCASVHAANCMANLAPA